MSARLCAFCNQPVEKSPEHVFSKSLLKELGLLTHGVQPRSRTFKPLTGELTGEVLHERPAHPLDQYRAGGICRGCNNSWMSDLENAAIPLLLPLIRRQRVLLHLGDLSAEESKILARWAYKTAVVIDQAAGTPKRLVIPATQRHAFHANQDDPPPHLWVFSAQRPHTKPVDYRVIEGPPMSRFGSYPEAQHPRAAAYYQSLYEGGATKHYMVGFQILDLLLGVFYWPFPQYPVMPVIGLHHPLWVPRDPGTAYIPQTLTSEGVLELSALKSETFTGAFLQNLAVFIP